MRHARSRWRSGGMTWSFVVTTTAVGTLIFASHGRELCRPRDATACPMANGLVLFHCASAHWPVSVGRDRERSSGPAGGLAGDAQPGEEVDRSHAELHALMERHLCGCATEVACRRGQHEAADAVRMLSPGALRDDPAHRVAGDDRLLQVERRDDGGNVVGAVGDREPVRHDAAPVPALVEHDDAVVLAELVRSPETRSALRCSRPRAAGSARARPGRRSRSATSGLDPGGRASGPPGVRPAESPPDGEASSTGRGRARMGLD